MSDVGEGSTAGKRSSLRAFVGLKVSAARAKAKVVQRREAQGKVPERGNSFAGGSSVPLGAPKGRLITSAGRFVTGAFKSVLPKLGSGKSRCAP